MPIVPTYDGPQLKQAGLEGGFQRTEDISSGQMQVAKGLDDVAAVVDKIDYGNALRDANGAEAKAREAWYTQDQVLRKKFQGELAGQYAPAAQQWWDDKKAELGEALSPRARGLIDKSLGNARVQALQSGSAWVAQENHTVMLQNYAATTLATMQGPLDAVKNSGAAALSQVDAAKLDLEQKAEKLGADLNWSGDRVKQEAIKNKTALIKDAVLQLAQKDPANAQKYWDGVDTKNDFDSRYIDEVNTKLKAITTATLGTSQGTTAYDNAVAAAAAEAAKNKKAPDPYFIPDELTLMRAIREENKGKPNEAALNHAASLGLAESLRMAKAGNESRVAGNLRAVYANVNAGMPISKVLNTTEALALPPDTRDQLRTTLVNTVEHRTVQQQRMFDFDHAPAALMYSRPDVLGNMTEDQVLALKPVLGDRHWNEVAAKHAAWTKDKAKLSEAQMDADSFDSIALPAGLDTKPKTTDKAAWAQLKYVHDVVEAEISKKQLKEHRVLTRDEKAVIMKTEISKEVVTPSFMYFWGEQNVLQAAVAPGKQGDYTVRVQLPDPGKPGELKEALVSAKNIPTDRFAKLKQSLQRRGMANTDADVIREWASIQSELASQQKAPTTSNVNQIPR